MLKQLTLSNFRLFDDEVTIRFRPITVLIGKNNSGKSSIIKFLLMLQQSLGLDELNERFIVPRGSKVKFSDFKSLKNRLTVDKSLAFKLSVTDNQSMTNAFDEYFDNRQIPKREKEEDLLFTTTSKILYNRNGTVTEHDVIISRDSKEILVKSKSSFQNGCFLNFNVQFQNENYFSQETNPALLAQYKAEKEAIRILHYNLNDIVHISATRAPMPDGGFVTSDIQNQNVGQQGEHTFPHLQKMWDGSNGPFILQHIKKVTGVKGIRFENFTENTYKCFATNTNTEAEMPVEDFGFGVSQCIPIIVQGAMMHKSTLMVEQPEAQVHPTAQLELGQFFVDLWHKNKVSSIIETHSGNILLRLQNCIAKKELKAEDVSVAYFNIHNGKPDVWNLDIDDNGDIDSRLPMEFFGADIIEWLNSDNRT